MTYTLRSVNSIKTEKEHNPATTLCSRESGSMVPDQEQDPQLASLYVDSDKLWHQVELF